MSKNPLIFYIDADAIVEIGEYGSHDRVLVHREHLVKVVSAAQSVNFEFLLDLYCIEHLSPATLSWTATIENWPVYEICYWLAGHHRHLHLSTILSDTDALPSISAHYRSSLWLERELWDLFGVYVEGHPHCRRILTHEQFTGHPLKKSYPLGRQQSLVAKMQL